MFFVLLNFLGFQTRLTWVYSFCLTPIKLGFLRSVLTLGWISIQFNLCLVAKKMQGNKQYFGFSILIFFLFNLLTVSKRVRSEKEKKKSPCSYINFLISRAIKQSIIEFLVRLLNPVSFWENLSHLLIALSEYYCYYLNYYQEIIVIVVVVVVVI